MSQENDDPHTSYLREMHDFDKHEAAYKEQLASALLAFNKVESTVADMISMMLRSRGRAELVEKLLFDRTFSQQLETLDLLMSSMLNAPRLPSAQLKSVARRRNEFAHSYFTADQNTGETYLKSRAKSQKWNPDKVAPFVKDCADAWKALDALWPWVAFGDTPAPAALPPDASATPID